MGRRIGRGGRGMSSPLQRAAEAALERLGSVARTQLFQDRADYRAPPGDPGLFGPDSLTWRVHANPVVLAVGGVAAVVLQLAEPRIRTGVWEHSDFRQDPLGRMRRTAQAAMLVTYGSSAAALQRISMVNLMHRRVTGLTPDGLAYDASNPELLRWVQSTASYCFLKAHIRYAEPDMSAADQDGYYVEAAKVGMRFGATRLPQTAEEAERGLLAMRPRLHAHPIVHEFLALVSGASSLGPTGIPLQAALIHASVALLPGWLIEALNLKRARFRTAASEQMLALLARAAAIVPNEIVREARARAGAAHYRGVT